MFCMLRLLWDYVTISSLLLGGGAGVGVAVASFYLELSEAADQVPRVKKTAPSTCGYLDPFSGTPVSSGLHSVRASSMRGARCGTLEPSVAYLAGSSVCHCFLGRSVERMGSPGVAQSEQRVGVSSLGEPDHTHLCEFS